MKTVVNGIEVEVLPLQGDEPEGTEVVLNLDRRFYFKKIGKNQVSLCKFLVWIPSLSIWSPTTLDVSHLIEQ